MRKRSTNSRRQDWTAIGSDWDRVGDPEQLMKQRSSGGELGPSFGEGGGNRLPLLVGKRPFVGAVDATGSDANRRRRDVPQRCRDGGDIRVRFDSNAGVGHRPTVTTRQTTSRHRDKISARDSTMRYLEWSWAGWRRSCGGIVRRKVRRKKWIHTRRPRSRAVRRTRRL